MRINTIIGNNNERNVFLGQDHKEWKKILETKMKTGDIDDKEAPERFKGMSQYPIHTAVANEDETITLSAHKIEKDLVGECYSLFSRHCGTLNPEESAGYLSRIREALRN